jgi:hypothetical protein
MDMTPDQAQLARQIPLSSGLKCGGDYGERRQPGAGDSFPEPGRQLRSGLRTVQNSLGIREVLQRAGHDAAPPVTNREPASDHEQRSPSSLRSLPPVFCECGCGTQLAKPQRGPMPRWLNDAHRMRAGRKRAQLAEMERRGYALPDRQQPSSADVRP